jgi:hypothetical protein
MVSPGLISSFFASGCVLAMPSPFDKPRVRNSPCEAVEA